MYGNCSRVNIIKEFGSGTIWNWIRIWNYMELDSDPELYGTGFGSETLHNFYIKTVTFDMTGKSLLTRTC